MSKCHRIQFISTRKCMKLIHSNISHVEIYLSCCNVLMVSLIQSAKNNGL